MPCYYTGSLEGDLRESISNQDAYIKSQKKELDLATRLLCSLTKKVPAQYLTDPELKAWMEKHAEMDRKRIEQEKKDQQEAIDLLEKKVLQAAKLKKEIDELIKKTEAVAKKGKKRKL